MNELKVYIIILNWNRGQDTIRCLNSLKLLEYGNFDIVVVDNGSRDWSLEEIGKRFPTIHLIKNEENLGFAEGCNVGIRFALKKGADCIMLLNNDVVVSLPFLTELVNILHLDPTVGIVGAVNYCSEKPDKIWNSGGLINWWAGITREVSHSHILDLGNSKSTIDVDCVVGSTLLIKRTVIEKIGLLASEFFAVYEDQDWCIRAKKAGYRVVLAPHVGVYHSPSSSISRPLYCYFTTRNKPLFMVRHAHKKYLLSFFLIYSMHTFLMWFLALIKGRRKEAIARGKGFIDFWLQKFGEGSLNEVISQK